MICVQVRRGGGRDRMGDPRPYTYHSIDGCVKWPRTSSETLDRSDLVATGYELSVPAGSDLLATDDVQLPGDDAWWSVEGDPLPWGPNPFTGHEPGIIVGLTRVTG